MAETVCNGCGGCCHPVTLPFTQMEAAQARNLDPRERHWILHELTPMSRREAKALAPWAFNTLIYGGSLNNSLPFYYRCMWYDTESRRCTNYEGRPDCCRDYPWSGQPPNRNAALPPACSFNEDIGRTVVPVTITKKESA